MKQTINIVFFVIMTFISRSCLSAEISKAEADILHSEINSMYKAYKSGDASLFLKKTHESIYTVAGGKQNFEEIFQSAVNQFNNQDVKIIEAVLGKPTKLYNAGNEEICFVPRVSVIEIQGKKIKSTGFLIAIRTKGGNSWSYLDGTGLRKDQRLLWKLFPELVENIELPANYAEIF